MLGGGCPCGSFWKPGSSFQALERVGGLCLNQEALLEGQEGGPSFSILSSHFCSSERPMVQVTAFRGHVDPGAPVRQ